VKTTVPKSETLATIMIQFDAGCPRLGRVEKKSEAIVFKTRHILVSERSGTSKVPASRVETFSGVVDQ
jgi:hypothetical protein